MPATAIASTHLNGIIPVTDPTPVAMDPVNGNLITNTGRTLVKVSNTDTASHVVTFHAVATMETLPVQNLTVTLVAGAVQWFTTFQTNVFGAQLTVTVDAGVTVKLAVIEP